MFGFIRDYITRKRLKRITESAFPTEDENRQQRWISDWFTVKPTEGYTPRYFTIEAKIYDNRFLKHGEIMAKFVSHGLLEDHWKEFRQLTMDYWKEFKDFKQDVYCRMRKIYRVLMIWDKLLDYELNIEILSQNIGIVTDTYFIERDCSYMVIRPKEAEKMLEIVQRQLPNDDPVSEEIFRRYKEYVINEFAIMCNPATLSASEPMVRINTFTNESYNIRIAIEEEEETKKLKIIPLILARKEERMTKK